MLAYVLNKKGEPLMPCKPGRARKLLDAGKAKVINRIPFTIKLLHGSSGHKQVVVAGMDTGSKVIGCAAIANGDVVYQSEVALRTDVSKKMQQRKMYRRTRRGRKCRYRKPRFLNRAVMRKEGCLAPSVNSKFQSHLREKRQVESILPITQWKVETASFDIHRITNPEVESIGYKNGPQKEFYNLKAFILHRDKYTCRSGRKIKHANNLHVHHIVYRSQGGTNTPNNLITLCKLCHDDLHKGKFEIKTNKSKTKHATEIGIIKAQLKKQWHFAETFGYETKFKREQILNLPKSHAYDAVAICCNDGDIVSSYNHIFYKKHVAKGDYQQTKGRRSEKRIPTGKLFGLRKYDLISTPHGEGFVKGKRATGYFAVEDIFGQKIHASFNIKKNTVRLKARTTTLIQREQVFNYPPNHLQGRGAVSLPNIEPVTNFV
ncbi:RNA-guided endonuclease IscB [Aliiglaciecola litoralis]|uniref:HNH nuclease domain-containing protein n=1 Tax=Aliiglaciecola litoralis TaxID=582857 RepID=A0ABP3WYJ6_9ALTE